jgi:hypothetical protein
MLSTSAMNGRGSAGLRQEIVIDSEAVFENGQREMREDRAGYL